MKTSERGIELIKLFEDFREIPYKCPGGEWTIGFGHVIKGMEVSPPLTREQAEELLRLDLQVFEAHVKRLVTVELKQNQFDALISFAYNLGAGKLEKSTLLKRVNQRQFKEAEIEFLKWNKVNHYVMRGLIVRRAVESKMFAGRLENVGLPEILEIERKKVTE